MTDQDPTVEQPADRQDAVVADAVRDLVQRAHAEEVRPDFDVAADVSDVLARAGVPLHATGIASRPRRARSTPQLTPQELQVALAVARGATNAQVAAQLFFSTKTIEYHLSNIYRKLGIRSRTQLAKAVSEQQTGEQRYRASSHINVEPRRASGPLGVLAHSTPAVSIQTLGEFQVIHGGVPIPNTSWKSRKARDLLKILIARRRPTPRDQLMELLWPEAEPAVAGNRLSVLLSTVRDVLQPHPVSEDPLVTTGGAVSLNRAQVSVDVENFLTQATAALDADRAKSPDATAQLAAAVTAHTGNFLEQDPYQEWAVGLAEEVRATHIALLHALSARLREAGDTDAAVRYTLRLLQQDHYDKQAHLTLVGALLDAGRLGEARRHYNSYVSRMKEIDVQPSPLSEMQVRYQRVIAIYASVNIPNDDGHNTSGSLDPDELDQVSVGDPDPTANLGTAAQYRPCRFEWADETSPTLRLHWSCNRESGHQGQHVASTGERIAAVHPPLFANSDGKPASQRDRC